MDFNLLTFLQLGPLTLAYSLSALAIGRVLLTKTNPRSALAWTVALIFLPWVGVILYAIFGIGRAESRAAKLMRRAKLKADNLEHIAESAKAEQVSIMPKPQAYIPVNFKGMSLVGEKLTTKPLLPGNGVFPLFFGDAAYTVMLDAIHNAKEYVYLTTYIFNGGEVGNLFVDALRAAAKRGVDVRLLVDGMGQWYSWSRPWRVLRNEGVQVAEFLPFRIIPPNLTVNLRNHRKVLVADNRGFTGGMNIADYFKQSHKNFSVQDIHFFCQGPIVDELREAFLLDWGFCTHDYAVPVRKTIPNYEENPGGEVLCRMVLDGPGTGNDPLHDIIFSAIAAAQKNVRIMTPYFLPTHEVVGALNAAALRGVNVDIILPAKNNILPVHFATFHLLPSLLDAGVHVFYQEPPFAHSKLLIVDDYYVQIGSANFDARSLRLNFELNVECFHHPFAKKMLDFFDKTKRESHVYTLEDSESRGLPKRLMHAACWLFSPYL